jgi:alpha-L-fucosidase 2
MKREVLGEEHVAHASLPQVRENSVVRELTGIHGQSLDAAPEPSYARTLVEASEPDMISTASAGYDATVTILITAILSLILLAHTAQASPQPCPALTVRNPDGNYIVPGVRGDIPYASDLALDAYVQQGGRQRPSVVVIHGGSWTSGSRIAHVGQLLELLTRAGYNWFSVDYRLGGLERTADALADLRSALAFLRCRAGDLGINPERLVLLGEDSGAHLAALLAAERPAGVIGAVLLGGFYDLAAIPSLARAFAGEVLAAASPGARVVPGMPPLLVVHGGGDTDAPIDQARRYCRDVIGARGRCAFLEVDGASHRVENWWPSQWTYKREIVRWLARLGPVPRTASAPAGALQKDIVYSPPTNLKLDAFVSRAPAPVPGVIVVHGGGWEAGDKVTYVTPLFEPLARAGFAWFSIDYRLTPAVTIQAQLEDVRQAIRFVRAHHARFGIDPSRIVLVGESASGQLVTQVAAEDASIAGVISFYGVYDFPAMVTDVSPRSLLVRLFRRTVLDDESRMLLRRWSPLYSAHKEMPPALLINGTGERLWAQAQTFAKRLTELGVRHDVVALDGAPHGMENWEGHPEWLVYKERMVRWIKGLKQPAPEAIR